MLSRPSSSPDWNDLVQDPDDFRIRVVRLQPGMEITVLAVGNRHATDQFLECRWQSREPRGCQNRR